MSGEKSPDRLDRCICGTLVAPHWVGEADGSGAQLERGSCLACGLQLVRRSGDLWHHIRG